MLSNFIIYQYWKNINNYTNDDNFRYIKESILTNIYKIFQGHNSSAKTLVIIIF